MNNQKLSLTHTHLTRVFTLVVVGIIFVIGISFTITKYIHENRIQKRDFLNEIITTTNTIQANNGAVERFLTNPSSFPNLKKLQSLREKNPNILPRNTSFFILEDEEIIFEKIFEQPEFMTLDFPESKLILSKESYIYIFSLENKKYVFYQKQQYSIEEFGQDLGILLLLVIIFGGLMYFIGHRFVERALLPVEESLEDMKYFIHNAGHELKTPLAVMHGNLQIIQAEKKYDPELIASSIRNIDTMNGLIEGLRELSEVGRSLTQEFCLLSEVVSGVVEQYEPQIREKDITLSTAIQSKLSVRANRNELHMLFANLISNAMKYTSVGGSIEVNLSKNIFSIQDTGVGISPEEQEKIFERFYQSTQHRSHEGFGIGLSLVKKIADVNNWKIELESEIGKGSKFIVIF